MILISAANTFDVESALGVFCSILSTRLLALRPLHTHSCTRCPTNMVQAQGAQ